MGYPVFSGLKIFFWWWGRGEIPSDLVFLGTHLCGTLTCIVGTLTTCKLLVCSEMMRKCQQQQGPILESRHPSSHSNLLTFFWKVPARPILDARGSAANVRK